MTPYAWLSRSVALAALVLLSLCPTARGQDWWRSVIVRSAQEYGQNILGGEATQHMQGLDRSVSKPDVIYLSHDCAQIWRSTDNGENWLKCRCEGMYVQAGQSIAADPVDERRVLCVMDASFNYLAEAGEGVYLSADSGDTWSLVKTMPTQNQRFSQHCLAWDPNALGEDRAWRWFLANPRDHLYRSVDGGESWTAMASLATHSTIYTLQCSSTGLLYLGSSAGLQVSTDGGMTFSPFGNLPSGTVTAVEIDPRDPARVYAVVAGNGLYRSDDSGASFTRIYSSSSALFFKQNPGFPDRMYLSFNSSQMRTSSNGGSSWSQVTAAAPLGLDRSWLTGLLGTFTSISPDPRDARTATVYSNSIAWKTTDGQNFHNSSDRLTGFNWGWWADSVAYDVADPQRFVFFCADISMAITENGGLWFERHRVPRAWYTSGLINWTSAYAGDIYPVTGSERMAIAGGMTQNLKLMLTTDGGPDLAIVNNDYHYNLFVAFNANNPSIVYAGNKRSTDAGASYAEIPYLVSSGRDACIVGMCHSNNDIVYAMNKDRSQIFRSDDAGVTWRLYVQTSWSMGRLDSRPGLFDVDPVNGDIIYALYSNGDLARYNGSRWTPLGVVNLASVPTRSNYVNMVKVDPRHGEILYALMHASGGPQVFRSIDGGASWQDITFNLARVGAGAISVHPLTGDVMISHGAGTRLLAAPYADAASLYPTLTPDPPVALAGRGIVARDLDGDGLATVTLDGRESYAPDSFILTHIWSLEGTALSSNALAEIELPVGHHSVDLEVWDTNLVTAYDSVDVTVIACVPGDADGDGHVNVNDFVILKQNYNIASGANWEMGDFDGDGAVNVNDFIILKQNYNR